MRVDRAWRLSLSALLIAASAHAQQRPTDTTYDCCVGVDAPDGLAAPRGLTISGTVTDSAGEGVPGASVMIAKLGLGAMTDQSGYFSLVIPRARANGATATLIVHQLGHAAYEDSITLVGESIRRHIVLRKPIYEMTVAQVLALDKGMEQAAGLSDLASGPHRAGEREIRVRIFGSWIGPYHMYRFVNRSGHATGELIWYFHNRHGEELKPDTGEVERMLRRECRRITRGKEFTCRVRFASDPNWRTLWKSLDSLDVWRIADEGPLRKHDGMMLDGSWIATEMWDGQSYKAWSYGPSVEDDEQGRAKVDVIESMLLGIDSLTVP